MVDKFRRSGQALARLRVRVKAAFPWGIVIIALGVALPAKADRAVVVGVGKYAHLGSVSELKGSVNDARAVAERLNENGFQVKLLVDAEATKAAILQAIVDSGKGIGPSERFVFYFAGHGTDKPPALLPADADRKGNGEESTFQPETVLTRLELHTVVDALPTVNRTVLLDACFSGGLKSGPRSSTARARYYSLTDNTKDVPANGGDGIVAGLPGKKKAKPTDTGPDTTVYVAASGNNEKAYEDEYTRTADGLKLPVAYQTDGAKVGPGSKEYHGHFTANLLPHLAKDKLGKESVGAVVDDITARVVAVTDDLQKPAKSNGFDTEPLIGLPTAPAEKAPAAVKEARAEWGRVLASEGDKAKQRTLWETFTLNHPNTDVISLSIFPDKTSATQGGQGSLTWEIKKEGYLVILDRDQENRVAILFPDPSLKEDCHVLPGTQMTPVQFKFIDPGTERLRALLFPRREDAEKVMQTFLEIKESNRNLSTLSTKTLERLGIGVTEVYTAQVIYEVAPQIPAKDGKP